MNELQAQAFEAIAVAAFPGASGDVVVDAGTVRYLVTLDEGVATAVQPAPPE